MLCYCSTFVAQKYLANAPLWTLPDSQTQSMFLQANSYVSKYCYFVAGDDIVISRVCYSIMLITYLVAGFSTPFFGTFIDNGMSDRLKVASVGVTK